MNQGMNFTLNRFGRLFDVITNNVDVEVFVDHRNIRSIKPKPHQVKKVYFQCIKSICEAHSFQELINI